MRRDHLPADAVPELDARRSGRATELAEIAELARGGVSTAQELAVDDDARAHAGTEREEDEVAHRCRNATPPLRERSRVGVLLDRRVHAEPFGDHLAEHDVAPLPKLACADDPSTPVDQPRDRQAGRPELAALARSARDQGFGRRCEALDEDARSLFRRRREARHGHELARTDVVEPNRGLRSADVPTDHEAVAVLLLV